VEGMYLSDNPEKPQKYQITKGNSQASTVIPAHGHLVIWCDKENPVSQLHASFKLCAEGGNMLLTAADNTWSDKFTYPQLQSDQTAGHWPDGCGDVFVMNVPTIAKANIRSSYLKVVEQTDFTGIHDTMADETGGISLAYHAGSLVISGNTSGAAQIFVHNLAGQTVATLTPDLFGGYAEVALTGLTSGVYIATLRDADGHRVSCKFIHNIK